MILISLMLAATPPPAVKPPRAGPPQPVAERRTRPVTPSKRLIELEAAVRSLPIAADERGQGGPEGL